MIQPGRTIFKTLGAKGACRAVERSNTKAHGEESGSAAVRVVVAERLAEQVYAVLCGDERGQLTTATLRPAIKTYIHVYIFFIIIYIFSDRFPLKGPLNIPLWAGSGPGAAN